MVCVHKLEASKCRKKSYVECRIIINIIVDAFVFSFKKMYFTERSWEFVFLFSATTAGNLHSQPI